jgi:DNA topoisomerase-1
MNLVIVESPSKCLLIEKYLQDKNVICLATGGHFRNIKLLKDIVIDVNNQEEPIQIIYSMIHDKKQNIDKIQKQIQIANEIILATDNDREGESIAWHICDYFRLDVKTTKRIVFNEITESVIINAFEHPTCLNMNIVSSQKARQVLDFLIGFYCSPILWKEFPTLKTKLSCGRCQTPALQLIYDNQMNIDNNLELKIFHHVIGYFTNQYIPFHLNHEFPYNENSNHEDIIFYLQNASTFDHIYSYDIQSISLSSPIPFNTCTLQQAASQILQYSPKETMQYCQTLYEKGYITYLRTESTQISPSFISIVQTYIEKKYGPTYIGVKCDDDNNNNNDYDDDIEIKTHEAIRVTNIQLCNSLSLIHHLNNKEIKMYQLIYQNTLSSCMSNSIISVLTATIQSCHSYTFQHKCEIPIFLGWKIVYKSKDENNHLYHYLQHLQNHIPIQEIVTTLSIQNNTSHWTESHLIHELQHLGIGKPSTFASIVDKIQQRQYVKKQNIQGTKNQFQHFKLESQKITPFSVIEEIGNEINKLVLQPLGHDVNQLLQTHFADIFNYQNSKQMEIQFQLIANNQEIWWNICLHYYQLLKEHLELYNNNKKTIITTTTSETPKTDTNTNQQKSNGNLGLYNDKSVTVKKGPWGLFVIYGDKNISLKYLGNRPIENITLNEIQSVLDGKEENILRIINENAIIMKGKKRKPDYIEWKQSKKSKPTFISLKTFSENYFDCDIEILENWLRIEFGLL